MPELIRKIEPGDVIGRCRAIRELGRGGVGTVYLATHQTLRIDVALKVLSPSLSLENPALAERFVLEAQLAARIRHPNVIAVMDAALDETTGLSYIVMEYIGGGSLSWHLRHGPIPEAKALGIVAGIAQALVVAEENRIVHRDIKPDNIMLDLRGTPKLADLGLAKQSLDSHTSLTLGGAFMGTPAYMSPEQARDAKVADTRDDIYSLGATFYECLTGMPPFQGETPYNIMSELLTKPSPQPRDTHPGISRSVDLICRKMMAKSRHLRYASARALLDDLTICQTHGEAGFDRLEASSFERDSVKELQQAQAYGVQTAADGVYVPEMEDEDEADEEPVQRPALIVPRRKDYGVFGAAVLLIGLVTVVTMVLAWIGPHQISFFSNPKTEAPVTPLPAPPDETKSKPKKKIEDTVPKPKPPKKKERPSEVTSTAMPPDDSPPVLKDPEVAAPRALPVAVPAPPPVYPVDPDMSNAVPARPVSPEELLAVPEYPAAVPVTDPNLVGPPVPVAPPVAPVTSYDSAFAARAIAESSLDKSLTARTGRAELLRIIGPHEEGKLTPPTWIFYFYDKEATGHARVVTVSGGRVEKNHEDALNLVSPYNEGMIVAEGRTIDSTQALETAEALVPNVTFSSAQYLLSQKKNSAATWLVILWAKTSEGKERKLGEVTMLAETGFVLRKDLRP